MLGNICHDALQVDHASDSYGLRGFYMFVLKDFDYPVAITGLIGIYLIMCLYSAVGLFVSCLTSYQVVAAIGTFCGVDYFTGYWWGFTRSGFLERYYLLDL